MKRLIALILAAALLLLCGCSQEENTNTETQATPTAAPTAAPTPIARLSASDYSYREYRNTTIRLKFLVPTHWVQRDGKNVVSFHEPVNNGEVDSMASLSIKTFSRDVASDKFRSESAAYLAYIGSQLEEFSASELTSGTTFIDREGLSATYTGKLNGVSVKGYVVLIVNATKLYAFHFRSEAGRYDDLSVVLSYMRDSFEGITVMQ